MYASPIFILEFLDIQFPPNFFNGTISYSHLSNYTFDYDFPAGDKINVVSFFAGHSTQQNFFHQDS